MQIMRIGHGKLKPGAWDAFEVAYKESIAKAGHVAGLVARSLVRDISDPDAGYSVSIWESEEAFRRYEATELEKTIGPFLQPFFTGEYQSRLCDLRYWEVIGEGPMQVSSS